MENYAILRIQKLKSFNDISAMTAHWLRTKHTPNADPARKHCNRVLQGSGNSFDDFNKLIKSRGITKFRKNGVYGLEYVLAFSPSYIRDEATGSYLSDAKIRLKHWINLSTKWLLDQYGDNFISAELHGDERNYHIHALIGVCEKRQDKLGNKIYALNARGITGGKARLSAIQDSYADALKETGLQRGNKRSKTKASHQSISQFYKAINHSKALCEGLNINPPEPHPTKFNVWMNTISQLTSSLEKAKENDSLHAKELIRDLLCANNKLLKTYNIPSNRRPN